MKKEIELETGVFVPPKKETQDIPGTLGSAREILRRVLLEAGSAPVRSDPGKTENGENAPAEIPGETPFPGKLRLFPLFLRLFPVLPGERYCRETRFSAQPGKQEKPSKTPFWSRCPWS